MHANVKFILFFFLGLCATHANAELTGFVASALQLLGFNLHSQGTGSAMLAKMSRGQSQYSFKSYALMGDRHICMPDDEYIIHLAKLPQQRKPPIMVRCLQPQGPMPAPAYDGSVPIPQLLVMKSVKEIVNLLKPVGNATKRHELGSCVLIHFCTDTSWQCARTAPIINFLPHVFPTLPMAYIDAYKFPRFNAEFGIVSLPTLMIFHQGRPIIKYDWPNKDVHIFIKRHTNVRSVDLRYIHPIQVRRLQLGPLPLKATITTDFYLILAWAFILICLANYVRRTLFWKQLVEMVQRNWRESEETQMENIN